VFSALFRQARRSRSSAVLPIRRDIFGFEKLEQSVVSAFSTDITLLHATEGCGWIGNDASIETDHAGFDLCGAG
jgi:hypothetical protein